VTSPPKKTVRSIREGARELGISATSLRRLLGRERSGMEHARRRVPLLMSTIGDLDQRMERIEQRVIGVERSLEHLTQSLNQLLATLEQSL
jgi:chromosome segregation ATPase